jgi:flavin reductase (DIM6/NTAB) family NADH-FMN oxidoreductase RutF
MEKTQIDPSPLIYPAPTLIVGATIDGKANFMTAAWNGIACGNPPMLSVAIRPNRYTLVGIKQNMSFSINVPSTDLVKETDYCGIVSGSKVNKAEVCKFKIFYGKLENAPLIEQCPINLGCKVEHILNLGSHYLVVGRVEETYVSNSGLTNGKPDISKMQLFSYITRPSMSKGSPAGEYRAVGELVASAYSIGNELIVKQ